MHHQRQIFRRAPVSLALALVLLVVSAPTVTAARPASGSDKTYYDLQQQVGRLRGLTLAILRQLKEHDAAYRGKNGKPLPDRVAAGRQDLSRTKPLVDAFQALAAEVPGLLARLKKESVDTARGTADAASQRKAEVVRLEADFKKYQAYVDQFWGRAVADFGRPADIAEKPASLEKGRMYTFTGEANLLLGTSSYKRPSVKPRFKSSATDFGFGVAGKFIPRDNTTLDLYANYKKTVERREIGLSNFGLAATHIFSPKFTAGIGADFAKYTDEDAKINSYSENGVSASATWTPSRVRLVSKLKWFSRGYGQVDGADYGVTTLNNDLLVPVGNGDARFRLNYLKQSNDAEAADHSDFNPAVLWRLSPNGTEMGIDYRKLSYPNFDDCPLESNRTRLSLLMKAGSGTTTRSWGPEVVIFSYPNAEANNYVDFKLGYQSTSGGKKLSRKSFSVVYRLYDDSTQFDFAQLEWRTSKSPIGSGWYKKWNLTARYYTESTDEKKVDKVTYLSNPAGLRPPHTADFYWGLGWMRSSTSWVAQVSIGPTFGARTLFDTERDKYDEKYRGIAANDIDYILRHPQNTVRGGLEAQARLVPGPGVVWDLKIEYTYALLYNADPTRSSNILRFETRASYPIRADLMLDGYSTFHRTRAELESAADLDQSDFGIKLRYLFDVEK